MTAQIFCELARRLMRQPAAPYHEAAVRAEAERICREQRLEHWRDRFGNLFVRLRTAPKMRPLVLAAHTDHPGFKMIRTLGPGRWAAQFLGGVPDRYFRRGLQVRLLPGPVAATLGRPRGKPKEFELLARARARSSAIGVRPEFAVWELVDFAVRRGRIYGRACDDLIGVTAILASLIEMKRRRDRVNMLGVISRAEEIGFRGALSVAAAGAIPRSALVISLESSRELPGAIMGQGVILRVGDRVSTFNPQAARFLHEVAEKLSRRIRSFKFQRALMSGGTCEATAYQEFGFQTAAVCVALGNYHNCGAGNRIAGEYVSVADACRMTQLLVGAAREMGQYRKLVRKLPDRLNMLLRQARPELLRTAGRE